MGLDTVRVCYFGTYRESYSRNVIMIEALRRANVEVIECHQTLWHGIEDRVSIASGGWANLRFVGRLLRAYWHLVSKHQHIGEYDVMVVGYPGQIDVFLAWVLTRIKRKPLVLDIFMSLYLIALERGLVERHPFTGRLLHFIEKTAYHLPDRLIQDTEDYKTWLVTEFQINTDTFRLVPTGADDRFFHPVSVSSKNPDRFIVLYYGSYIPNHGVPYIMEAAKFLGDAHDIMFILIGDGPDKTAARKFTEDHHLTNVKFIPWLSQEELVSYIANADICLGAFGSTPQSMMTVQNKIYECMAMGKPVITGESNAVRDAFDHQKNVFLVERTNGFAISQAVQYLQKDTGLRGDIGLNGYELFREKYNLDAQGERIKSHLEGLLG